MNATTKTCCLLGNPVGHSKSPFIHNTLAKMMGINMVYTAYKVEDGVANALAECEQKEVRTIDKAPRAGAEGLKIAFLHPKATKGVLTELCEE